jgi:polysaccharide biosynthesis transport protein
MSDSSLKIIHADTESSGPPFQPILALRKHWLLASTVTGLVFAAAVFITLGMTRIYEATATVLFDPNVPRPLGNQIETVVATDGSTYLNNKEYYRTQIWVIQSMRVASEVVVRLGLQKDSWFRAAAGGKDPTVEHAAKLLLTNVDVALVRDSRLVTVSYRDPDPERARRILSALVDTYVQQNLDDVFESATTAADWLRSQLGTLRKELEASELALHDYKTDKNILSVSLDDQSNMIRAEMQQLGSSLTQVKARRQHVLARVQAVRTIPSDDPLKLPALELIESPVLQKLRDSYIVGAQAYESLRKEGKGENHPALRSAEAGMSTAKAALLEEVRNIQGAFERELTSLDKEVAGLQALYDQSEKRALDLSLLEIEYNRLRRSKDNNEKLFSLVIERSKETDLTRMLRVNNIRVVDRPLTPERPVRPNMPLNLAGGLVGGLLLGFVFAVGRERLDRTVKTPDDIDRELRLPFLGLIPQVGTESPSGRRQRRARQKGNAGDMVELISHREPTAGVAEAARAMRTNIMFMSPDRPHRTLLITSSAPAEGKTMVACLLATAMAQAGQRVLLIDCDLRRPRLHRVFGKSNDSGVTSALLSSEPAKNAVQRTEVQNLSVIPSGPLPPNPAELLQSETFANFLSALEQEFDRIIIDSPPVVPVTDAAVLCNRTDGAILVVQASKTTRDLARRGARALTDVGARIVGVALNAVDLRSGHYGYEQYYYYRREGYAEPTAPSGKSSAA